MKVVIAGGSGFMGRYLQNRFSADEHSVFVLTRKPTLSQDIYWDGETFSDWTTVLENTDLLINLAGKSVDCRYTQRNRKTILLSRVRSTKALADAISKVSNPPKIWINSSTATIYEHSVSRPNDEETGIIGSGFSEQVAKTWESTFFAAKLPNTKQMVIRTAIVLGNDGGALPILVKLAKLGLGGKQHTGNQKISWVHQEDVYRAILFLVSQQNLPSVFNLVSPGAIANDAFMHTLRSALDIKFGLSQPRILLELGAFFLRTETELILKSRYVAPLRLTQLGFSFTFAHISDAIKDLVKPKVKI